MVVKGKMQYKFAIIVDDKFIRDIDTLIKEYFAEPTYYADLLNGDQIEFDSVSELINYDNFASRAISALTIRSGIENFMYIMPWGGVINEYKSTINWKFEIDNNDKCEEVKRKAKEIFDKHKQSIMYTLASKFSIAHICSIVLALGVALNFYIWFILHNQAKEVTNITMVGIWIIAIICFTVIEKFISYMVKKFFPSVVFYLGENIKKIENFSKLKSNLFWGVIVAVMVSVVASKIV